MHPAKLLLPLSLVLGFGPAAAENIQVAPAPAQAPAAKASLADLGRLMDERLSLMPEVARHKWNTGSPIDDLPREERIVEDLKARAVALGLPEDYAARFFVAQIEAAKIIQRELFATWRAAGIGKFDQVPDLSTAIRPRLDALTPKLLQALADNRERLLAPGLPLSRSELGPLAVERTSPAAAAVALAPLLR